ncbi:MAG: pyridoxamine kinase [Clostridia bacterium]|nr:pyridoxamine kinase [Clostridia bacterium]
MLQQKRIAAIHDISCFGRCSLTVALPIISAAGIEVSVIPTALLSTHTGGIAGYTYRDLSDDMLAIMNHWQSLHLQFDAVYTGFLGSTKQLDIVSKIFDQFATQGQLIIVDPVMADNGLLYKSFPDTFPQGMRKLCQKADIIIPNITEAVFLLGEPYQKGPYTELYIEQMLKRLAALGPKQIVITGVHFNDKTIGAASYDAISKKVEYAFSDLVKGYYPGTGDVFGSVLVGFLLNGCELSKAVRNAVDFTAASIARTNTAGTDRRFGVHFEAELPKLIQRLGLI